MKTVSMSGALRAHVGKKDAKMHRKESKIPCVLYGGKEQIHFVVDEKSFSRIIFTPDVYLVKLSIEKKEHIAILQDVQYHPVSDRVLHADFLEAVEGKPVSVSLPIQVEGNSVGVIRGGKLIIKMRKIKVRGLVSDIPDYITLNIDKLDIGDSIRIRDIQVEKLNFSDTPGAVVVTVKTARGAAAGQLEEEEAAGGETPQEKTEGGE
ncbi:MAG: 50S ribosomal protein L25 [Bacteroidales bacterium]|nr:50S ribosomal protein L25 [Bacteroidales bacterium]